MSQYRFYRVALLFALTAASSSSSHANPLQAPPSFIPAGMTDRAVFVDFIEARYSMKFEVGKATAQVESTITYKSQEAGMPVFDLVTDPSSVQLDGAPVKWATINTPKETFGSSTIRIAQASVPAGTHTLVIRHTLQAIAEQSSVTVGFFNSDLNNRGLLEQYLPANFEFDQLSMTFDIEIRGLKVQQSIFTNGDLTQTAANRWTIRFPEYYNAASSYFHMGATKRFLIKEFEIHSIDGRKLAAKVYCPTARTCKTELLDSFIAASTSYITAFEKDYGPFPHPALTILATHEGGGMEYAGATVSSLYALSHELIHSYFARAVMPAEGNAGWIDEAMAIWAGGPYEPGEILDEPVNMARHGLYFRGNDDLGYEHGSGVLEAYNQLLQAAKPGVTFKDFLRHWFEKYKFQTVTTPMLQAELESFAGISVQALFDRSVYGVGAATPMEPSRVRSRGRESTGLKFNLQQFLKLTR